MSAQCWCHACCGQVVTRNTFVAHGRKHKPDVPKRRKVSVPLVSLDNNPVTLHNDNTIAVSSSDENSDDNSQESSDENNDDQNSTTIGRADLSMREISVLLMDMMCAHKQTDAAAQHFWQISDLLTPNTGQLPSFHKVDCCIIIIVFIIISKILGQRPDQKK